MNQPQDHCRACFQVDMLARDADADLSHDEHRYFNRQTNDRWQRWQSCWAVARATQLAEVCAGGDA